LVSTDRIISYIWILDYNTENIAYYSALGTSTYYLYPIVLCATIIHRSTLFITFFALLYTAVFSRGGGTSIDDCFTIK